MCPELCGCKVQEQKGKAIFILLLIMAVVYFIGYLCTCCFNQVTSARLALQQADGWALPGLALAQLELCLLLFGQPCLALPRRKFGMAQPALLCACAVHPQKLQSISDAGCRSLTGDPEKLRCFSLQGPPAAQASCWRTEASCQRQITLEKPRIFALSQAKGPFLWCVSLFPLKQ